MARPPANSPSPEPIAPRPLPSLPRPSRAPSPALDPASEAWKLVKDSTNPADFDRFADAFASSGLASAARFRATNCAPPLPPPPQLPFRRPTPNPTRWQPRSSRNPNLPSACFVARRQSGLTLAKLRRRYVMEVSEVGAGGAITGQWKQAFVAEGPPGKSTTRLEEAPPSTLRNVVVTQDDISKSAGVTSFYLGPEDTSLYNFSLLGTRVGSINAYVLDIAPSNRRPASITSKDESGWRTRISKSSCSAAILLAKASTRAIPCSPSIARKSTASGSPPPPRRITSLASPTESRSRSTLRFDGLPVLSQLLVGNLWIPTDTSLSTINTPARSGAALPHRPRLPRLVLAASFPTRVSHIVPDLTQTPTLTARPWSRHPAC